MYRRKALGGVNDNMNDGKGNSIDSWRLETRVLELLGLPWVCGKCVASVAYRKRKVRNGTACGFCEERGIDIRGIYRD